MSSEPGKGDGDSPPAFGWPSCGRPLYDRRRLDCGYCGATILESLRLTAAQIEAFEDEREQKCSDMERFTRMRDNCCYQKKVWLA